MFLIIWIIYLGSVSAFPNNSSTVCFLHNKTQSYICDQHSMQLTCSGEHVIRINNIKVVKMSTGHLMCSKCETDYTESGWEIVKDIVYFETLLYQACSRKSRCNFLQDNIQTIEQSKYIWKANINYECVSIGLFKNICSPWKQTTDTVHISMNRTGKATGNCSCIVQAYTENINMEVVDYRPYLNDLRCAGITIIIGDSVMPQCENDGIDVSMYNTNMTVINNVTTISVLFSEYFPQMIWIHVEGNNMTVQCNNEGMSSTSSPSSSSTTDYIFTDTLTTLPETTKENTNTETNTAMTTSSLLNKGNEDRTIFSLPVIAGGSAGNQDEKSSSLVVIVVGTAGLLAFVVIIAVIICFHLRRKSNMAAKDRVMENMHTEYNAQPNITNTTRIGNGWDINQGGEPVNKMINIKMKNNSDSNYEEVGEKKGENGDDGDSKEYAEPANIAVDRIHADSETTGIQVSLKVRNKIEQHNNTETYEDLVISNENQNNYDKLYTRNKIEGHDKTETYEALVIDNTCQNNYEILFIHSE